MSRERSPRPRPGRPLGPNLATGAAHAFFERAAKLGLRLPDILRQLHAAKFSVPSYRTLQDWRRGLHVPYFVPFNDWAAALRMERPRDEAPAKTQLANRRAP